MHNKFLSRWLASIGPGLIIAALVFGPSKMTITSKMGASFGFALIWVIVVAIFFMIIYSSMAGRIGTATSKSLLTTISEKWGRPVSVIVGIGIFLVCISFQAGNSIGVGIAIAELTHTPRLIWIIVFNLIGISLLFFREFYKTLEKLMILLIVLMLLCFVITLAFVKPPVEKAFTGLWPSIPKGALGLVIAFTASCFSIVGAFYNAYLVQERRRLNPDYNIKSNSSVVGIVILGVLSAIVMICAASVLMPRGISIDTATDMSVALRPVFGNYASALFLIGLFGASFSSIVGTASIGGILLGDALGQGSSFNSKINKLFISIVMIAGAVIAIVLGKLPLELIVLAQSVTIFLAPIAGIAMYLIANDAAIMGVHKNNLFYRISGFVGLAVIICLAIINFKDIFLK